jgi:hypothetical protein
MIHVMSRAGVNPGRPGQRLPVEAARFVYAGLEAIAEIASTRREDGRSDLS